MKRNSKEEKIKAEDRLYKYYNSLDTSLIWVPVEEPQFLGWELQVVLGDSGSRRRDASELQEVLNLLGANKPVFTKHRWVLASVRGAGGNYQRAIENCKKSMGRKAKWNDIWWGAEVGRYIPYLFDTRLSERQYEELPGYLKKYFDVYKDYGNVWTPGNYYKVRPFGVFPFYELRIKVTKAWSTHRGIPQPFNESEGTKLRDKFRNEAYWSRTGRGDSSESYYNKRNRRINRKSWKQSLGHLSKHYVHNDSLEVIEEAERVAASRAIGTYW